MKLIDRFLKKFGYQRSGSAYRGAEFNRLFSDWYAAILSADKNIQGDLLAMRARARDLKRNSPMCRRYLQLLRNNVIGPFGIGLQGQIKGADGKISEINTKIETAWKEWTKTVSADGKFSFRQFCALALDTWATDGEVFIRMMPGYKRNIHRFALQFIDADLIDEKYSVRAGGGQNEIRMGVEVDRWGWPAAYHCWEYHPADLNYVQSRGRIRIPAEEIIHFYTPDRVNQTRGIPVFSSILTAIRMLEGYIESESVAARIGAAKMGFFEKTEEIGSPAATDLDATPLRMEATPGTAEELPFGYKFVPWDNNHPSTAFPVFVKSMQRFVASGLGVAYNTLANDAEGVNFSSIRAFLLDERDSWRTCQQDVIASLISPVFENWIQFANLSGGLALPDRDYRKFLAVKWIPRGWAWVDPLKDAEAAVIKCNNGLGSRTRELTEQGEDFESILEDLKKENEAATAAGILISTPAKQTGPIPSDSEEEEETIPPGGPQ